LGIFRIMEEAKQERKTRRQIIEEDMSNRKTELKCLLPNYIQFCSNKIIEVENKTFLSINEIYGQIIFTDFWEQNEYRKKIKQENNFVQECNYSYQNIRHKNGCLLNKCLNVDINLLMNEITYPSTSQIQSPFIVLQIQKKQTNQFYCDDYSQILSDSFENFDCSMIDNCKFKICKSQDDMHFYFVLFFIDKNLYPTDYEFNEPTKIHCFQLNNVIHQEKTFNIF